MIVTERTDIPGCYTVQSGKELYHVDAREEPYSCDCASGCWAPHRPCKHCLAVRAVREGR